MSTPVSRGTICLEDAKILFQHALEGNQYILRVKAPRAASRAEPGSFAHITCDRTVPMRRPLSIMRADPADGWLEFLYKPVGEGLAKLATHREGECLSVLAPIGNSFRLDPGKPTVLAIGGGVGIPPMIFLAERYRKDERFRFIVLMGSEVPFPFELTPGRAHLERMPVSASASVALLESWGIASRLASGAGVSGCYGGFVTDLAREWLAALPAEAAAKTQVLGCGPSAMLEATAKLARAFELPCQLALEEYMACGVGGCAGCTVLIETPDGPAMKRVCVDGPVFDADQVYPG